MDACGKRQLTTQHSYIDGGVLVVASFLEINISINIMVMFVIEANANKNTNNYCVRARLCL